MQLNKFTDYALRVLLVLAHAKQNTYTIAMLSENLQVSQNHLVKIVHFMAKQKWIITSRGKGGGLRLAPEALALNLGHVVRSLQGNPQIVECHQPPCVFRNNCDLKGILDQALAQFYLYLEQYTLQDVVQLSQNTTKDTHSISILNLP